MKYSQDRQFERFAQRRMLEAQANRQDATEALNGPAYRKTLRDDFKPRSHGWCGAHNRNTKANSGTRQRAYPRKLEITQWVSVGGGK